MSDLIRELEALRVGPDEVLILRFPPTAASSDDEDWNPAEEVMGALRAVGLGDRSVLIFGDVEFAIVSREDAPSLRDEILGMLYAIESNIISECGNPDVYY